MIQSRAIEGSQNTALRLLPLPQRVDVSALGEGRAERANDNRLSALEAVRRGAGQSQQTDNFFSVRYGATVTLPQAVANSVTPPPIGRLPSGNGALSDEVVGFLLSANEVNSNEVDANSAARSRAVGGVGAYQDVAALFPRSQSSLFSIAT